MINSPEMNDRPLSVSIIKLNLSCIYELIYTSFVFNK